MHLRLWYEKAMLKYIYPVKTQANEGEQFLIFHVLLMLRATVI